MVDIISAIGSAVRPAANSLMNVDRKYKLLIDVRGDEALLQGRSVFPIEANLPERFHIEFSSNWTTPFANAGAGEMAAGLTGNAAVGSAVDGIAGAAGVGTKLRSQNIQVWESSSPLTLNLDLIFYAQENTEREIKEKQVALLKLTAPTTKVGDEVLIAPGPRLLGNTMTSDNVEGRRITLYIGDYMVLNDVIVKSVGTDIVTLMDDNGIPIAMSINLGVETWNACVTADQIEAMFYGGQKWPTS